MSGLGRLWAGTLFGTNTGKLYLEVSASAAANGLQTGQLKVSDDRFGLSEYDVQIGYSEDSVAIEGRPKVEVEGVVQGNIQAVAKKMPNGSLSGEWKSEIGTAGTFELHPHFGMESLPKTDLPEQLYTTNKDLGSIKLYKSDLTSIIEAMKRKFPNSRIVVSHFDRGAELALFVDDFEKIIPNLEKLTWIKLNAQSPAEGGFTRSLTIDLGQNFNRVTTQSPDESWVLGEAEATAAILRSKESWLSTAVGRHRVNINLLIMLAAIVAMPDLSILKRYVFIIGVLIITQAADKITQTLVPNFSLVLDRVKSNNSGQFWPSISSWLISASAGAASSFLYAALHGLFQSN